MLGKIDWFELDPWGLLSLEVPLVLVGLPVVFEPVDQHLKWDQVLVMEVEALWSHFDEFLVHLFFRHIAKHDVLRVLRKDCKSVWNSLWSFLLLLL